MLENPEIASSINTGNIKGQTALHVAVRENDLPLTQLLVEHGADVNARDTQGQTPLVAAAKFCYIDVVHYLIEHGANPDPKSAQGQYFLTFLEIPADNWQIQEDCYADLNAYLAKRRPSRWVPAGTALGRLQRQAELGNKQAQCALGKKYITGIEVAPDYNEAIHWLIKSADQGYVPACAPLIEMYSMPYSSGHVLAKSMINRTVPYKYLHEYIEEKNPECQVVAGEYREKGIKGYKPNPRLAKILYTRAAARGSQKAKAALARLATNP